MGIERLPSQPQSEDQTEKKDKEAKSMPILNEKPLGTSKKSPEKHSKHKTPVNIRKKSINEEEIRSKSHEETRQFQENFEVYMQTLISQCLDANFLTEIFSEEDDYFVSNIER